MKSAWRVGGGLIAGGSINVSSIRKVRVAASIPLVSSPSRRDGCSDVSICVFFPVPLPILRQAKQFSPWHLHQGQHLPAFYDQCIIARSNDFEAAPESSAVQLVQPSIYHELVRQLGGAAIVNFRADDDGISLSFGHFRQSQAELFREKSPGGFDKTQVGDVVHDSTAIRIEKHHLQFSANSRGGLAHVSTIIPKAFRNQRQTQL